MNRRRFFKYLGLGLGIVSIPNIALKSKSEEVIIRVTNTYQNKLFREQMMCCNGMWKNTWHISDNRILMTIAWLVKTEGTIISVIDKKAKQRYKEVMLHYKLDYNKIKDRIVIA